MRLILPLLLVTALVTPAAAQTSATVSGTVRDPSGAVLAGVTVTAKSGATGLTRTAVTGPEGRYVLPQLPPGEYELRAELGGFKPHIRPDVCPHRRAVIDAQYGPPGRGCRHRRRRHRQDAAGQYQRARN